MALKVLPTIRGLGSSVQALGFRVLVSRVEGFKGLRFRGLRGLRVFGGVCLERAVGGEMCPQAMILRLGNRI